MTPPAPRSREAIQQEIVARLCEVLETSPEQFDANRPFADYGLGSKEAIMLSGDVEDWLGCRLSPTVFYEYPSAAALAEHLAAAEASAESAHPQPSIGETREPIAIVGLSCRFPGARTLDRFRELIAEGRDAVARLPPEREALIGPDLVGRLPEHGRWGGFIDDVDVFDAPFFGIGAAEAASMDPQQRLLLETAWDALDHAAIPADGLAGSRSGVFVGVSTSDYALLRLRRSPGEVDAYFGTSNSPSVVAGRLSYLLGLNGPALAVDTACSSSLVAVHLACQSLRRGECDLALAGGVNLMLAPDTTLWACQARVLSSSGRCKTFDRSADGYVRAEGCGVVVLKRLRDALAANDNIAGLIRGSAVNHDGRSSGLTAPNGLAQQRVILEALVDARVAPSEVQYVEAHGTGTALGDPIEVRALGATLCADRPADRPLVIGSVKTNIGHLEAAAGIAGLIKVLVAFERDSIPRHLHVTEINPYIAQEKLPVVIADGSQSWRPDGSRVAGLSSFGLSGTNAHLVLEAWPPSPMPESPQAGEHTMFLLPVSARSAAALRARAEALCCFVRQWAGTLDRICYTAAVRSAHHSVRMAVWGATAEEIAQALEAWLAGIAQPPAAHKVATIAGRYVDGHDVDWEALYPSALRPMALPPYPFDRHRHWFSEPAGRSIRERLAEAAPGERDAVVKAFVIAELARTLQLPASRLDEDDALSRLGLDSLMAIDLTNRLTAAFGVPLAPANLLDGMTARQLMAALCEHGPVVRVEPLPPPAPVRTPFALSHAQQRIWILDQFASAQIAYTLPAALRIRGPLDPAALQSALRNSVARHDALRSVFTSIDGQPMQMVLEHADVTLPLEDMQSLPEPDRAAAAELRAADEAMRPFDLAKGPLFRTKLFRLAPDAHLLFVGIHHIVADGTSLGILLREVAEEYEAATVGRSVGRRAPALEYSQFVAWQRQQLASSALHLRHDQWIQALGGAAPLNLPTDRPRSAGQTFEGSSVPLEISRGLTDTLRTLAQRQGATLYGVLLTAFQILLARSAGQTDISVGTPMANRTRPEFESLVGCFANTVVIRSNIQGDLRFTEVLARVQRTIRDAWTRQDVPFEKLVETLGSREAGRHPLFDVFFALNAPMDATLAATRTSFAPVLLTTRAAKFDLALFCEDRPDGLSGFIEYRSALFDRATAQRTVDRFATLLEHIARAPETRIDGLDITAAYERAALETYSRPSPRPVSQHATVHSLVSEQALQSPNVTAVVDERESVTYRELDAWSDAIAAALRRRGCRRGEVAAVSMERSVAGVAALIGILKSGSAYLPIDPLAPPQRRELLVKEAGALRLDDLPLLVERARGSSSDRSWTSAPEDLAYVIYTSGSTGKPKGVEVTHRNVVNLLESMAHSPGLTARDVLLAVTTLTFDIAALEIYLPLICGARLVIASRDTAADGGLLTHAIREAHPTVMQATPATWRMLRESGYRPSRGMKVLCGGEALSSELAAWLTSDGAEVWNMYGPTETTIWSTIDQIRPGVAPSLGRSIANTEIHVFDGEHRWTPIGVAGEIYIGGAGVARGYRHQPELTAERFVECTISSGTAQRQARLYRTGDIGCWDADGRLHFLGRTDQQIKIRGFRIEPGEIEVALAAHPRVRAAAVIGRPVQDDDVRLCAFVEMDADAFSADALRTFLADLLPAYMVPSEYRCLDVLPLSSSGKVDRRALAATDVAPFMVRRDAPVMPRNAIESRLRTIWQDVLGTREIGVQDSFFDLGGHSLLAARIIARVESEFDVRLPLNLFYVQPTLEGHARHITESQADAGGRFERLLTFVEGLSDGEAAALCNAAHSRSTEQEAHGDQSECPDRGSFRDEAAVAGTNGPRSRRRAAATGSGTV